MNKHKKNTCAAGVNRVVNALKDFVIERQLDGLEIDCDDVIQSEHRHRFRSFIEKLAEMSLRGAQPFSISLR